MAGDLAIHQFPATGLTIRTLVRDGEQLLCLADACQGLQHSNPSVALQLVEEADRVLIDLRETDSPNLNRASINPRMWFVTESGFYDLAIESKAPGAKAFKRWITHEVLPALSKTGKYELDELEVARRYVKAIEDKRAAITRAEKAEGFKRAIEAGDGLQLRAFHKKYFSTTPERAFFDHLYNRGFLINQRGKGPAHPRTGEPTDGRQHRHPTFKGKEWFYLHGEVDRYGKRQENTRVRPGDPELALRDKLASQGLVPNEEPVALFELEVVV
jgi:prophage antirepressor-like protein